MTVGKLLLLGDGQLNSMKCQRFDMPRNPKSSLMSMGFDKCMIRGSEIGQQVIYLQM